MRVSSEMEESGMMHDHSTVLREESRQIRSVLLWSAATCRRFSDVAVRAVTSHRTPVCSVF